MAYIEKRNDKNGIVRYRAQIRLRGYPQQSATFNRRTDAKTWASQTEVAIKEGRHFKTAEAKRHTAAEMIDRYIQNVLPGKGSHRSNQLIQLTWWKDRIGHYLLADITPQLITQQKDELLAGAPDYKHKRSEATCNRYLAALSHCFTIAVQDWGWLEDNPLRNVRKYKEAPGRVRYLSDDERERLLKACMESQNPALYPIVVLALSTGARRDEILSLKWEQIDLKEGRITVYKTKNKEIKTLPLTGHALSEVKKLNKIRHIDTDLLFPGRDKSKPIDPRAPWEAALKKARVESFRFHDLRHTTASYLAQGGASPFEIAEVLGHKTLQQTKRYSHLSPQHTAKVVEKMNKRMFS
ncbi:MAG: site-specific integrase [Gammaproteobacteria bacterium]|nr:site-specific integrase [Gammaproteobacteria bacterium]